MLPEINPDATVESVLKASHWPDARHPIVLVGHQPYMGMIASQLIGGEAQMWNVKKAACGGSASACVTALAQKQPEAGAQSGHAHRQRRLSATGPSTATAWHTCPGRTSGLGG